jgi:hypothetical protein
MRKFYIICIFLTLFVGSCSEVEDTAVDLGLGYQPLAVGKFWEYAVAETIYFGESDVEISVYFYRDRVESDYFDEEGEQVFLIVREKSADRQTWQPEQTFTYKISKGTLIKYQDNRHLVALVFPPTPGKTWNANALNTSPEEYYQLQVLAQYQLDDADYRDVVKVVQQEEDDRITLRDQRYEVYAKGMGLVESYYEVLNYCSRNDCLGQQIIESGRFTHLKLIQDG